MSRQHLETHPWIAFDFDPREQLDYRTWMLLGEVLSKCGHIAGSPLQPDLADELNQIFLSKSAHATTRIEGNTLSEGEVLQRVRHQLDLPPSLEYLGQEVDNIVAAYNLIESDLAEGRSLALTRKRIEELNRLVLYKVPGAEKVAPGEIRTENVLVGSYRGAPPEDCGYLLDQLCKWLRVICKIAGEELRQPAAILSALLAHLYIAWIHPFRDGNGRTARLVEYQLLLHAGVPMLAAHLPANFYMRTRTRYYQVLQESSQESPYNPAGFLFYALEGFVDELREQVKIIQKQQLTAAWVNFVHETVPDGHSAASVRQRHLVLDLPSDRWTSISKIPELTPRLAAGYAGKTRRTVSRDVNTLEELGLILKSRGAVKPYIEQMRAFLPLRVESEDGAS
ncbi:Fic family protein [Streptosporangium subroseum]|uniref:Fic family protein n=1 Tax=Streptosporangium subroseum TaxID=106412 RepID=UPI003092F6B1|nr:Fic family protein [Streptosporangium subroseum]